MKRASETLRILLVAAAAGCFALPGPAIAVAAPAQEQRAPQPREDQIRQLIDSAEMHYKRGQDAYSSGQFDMARREFDEAVDTILIDSMGIQRDDGLRVYYRELIEKINHYQVASLEQKDGGFSEQRFEPSPLDKIASLSEAELEEAGGGASAADSVNPRLNFNFVAGYPIKQFINYFTRGRGRATMEAGLLRSVRYRGMAERIFKEEGVPTDLVWLAQLESGWNPYALSTAAAKGIWQFVPTTGARFGLAQNYWVDERSNPEKSTRAAARYLKWLATRYHNDWTLALAAYNTGEGNVDSAITRSGSRDFWRLHQGGFIAQETRNYVPAILAVATIAKNAKQYGFQAPHPLPYKYDTRTIAKQTELRPLAKKLNVSYGELLDLNPELQRGVTPPGPHVIRIPASLVPKPATSSAPGIPATGPEPAPNDLKPTP